VENLRKLGVDPADIKAVGITNQRETIIAWDKLTGEPLYNAIGKWWIDSIQMRMKWVFEKYCVFANDLLHPCTCHYIVWLDTRTATEVDEITSKPSSKAEAERIRRVCGLPMSTYFSALKMKWLLENVPAVMRAVEENRCLLGTVDSWLLWVCIGDYNDWAT